MEHEQLARTIAEAMASLPKHLAGLKSGLSGAAAAISKTLMMPG